MADKKDNSKAATIEAWKTKDPAWLAEKLWQARKERSQAKKDLTEMRNLLLRKDVSMYELEQLVHVYKEAAMEIGLQPTKLLVSFHIPVDEYVKEEEWGKLPYCSECYDEQCSDCVMTRWKPDIETAVLVWWAINDSTIRGITNRFKYYERKPYKIVDAKTMTVLYEDDEMEEKQC